MLARSEITQPYRLLGDPFVEAFKRNCKDKNGVENRKACNCRFSHASRPGLEVRARSVD